MKNNKDEKLTTTSVLLGPTGVLFNTSSNCPVGRSTCAGYKNGKLLRCLDLDGDFSSGIVGQEIKVLCGHKRPKHKSQRKEPRDS